MRVARERRLIYFGAMTMKPAPEVSHCVQTLRLKVKAEGYAWLNAAAAEINQVWNWANATAYKAARPFAGPGKWLSAYDLDNSPREPPQSSITSVRTRFNG
jgi:hypothetical protein